MQFVGRPRDENNPVRTGASWHCGSRTAVRVRQEIDGKISGKSNERELITARPRSRTVVTYRKASLPSIDNFRTRSNMSGSEVNHGRGGGKGNVDFVHTRLHLSDCIVRHSDL